MRIGILYIRSGPSTEEEFEGRFCERSKQTMSLGEEGVFGSSAGKSFPAFKDTWINLK